MPNDITLINSIDILPYRKNALRLLKEIPTDELEILLELKRKNLNFESTLERLKEIVRNENVIIQVKYKKHIFRSNTIEIFAIEKFKNNVNYKTIFINITEDISIILNLGKRKKIKVADRFWDLNRKLRGLIPGFPDLEDVKML